jgi:hypothetical protein
MVKLLFNRLRGSFVHRAIIYLDAQDTQDTLAKELADMLEQLGVTDVDRPWSAAALLTQLREFVLDKPVLLVLDDVRTAQQLDSLVPTQLGAGSHLIITSRHSCFPLSSTWRVSCSYIVLLASCDRLVLQHAMPDTVKSRRLL